MRTITLLMILLFVCGGLSAEETEFVYNGSSYKETKAGSLGTITYIEIRTMSGEVLNLFTGIKGADGSQLWGMDTFMVLGKEVRGATLGSSLITGVSYRVQFDSWNEMGTSIKFIMPALTGGGNYKPIQFILGDNRPRSLALESIPSGAEVWYDGKRQGLTPMSLTFTGQVSPLLTFKLSGYLDQTKRVVMTDRLSGTDRVDMGLYDMEPRLITVTSAPTVVANVLVNGIRVGTTGEPFIILGRIAPDTVLRVEANGIYSQGTIKALEPGSYSIPISLDAESRQVTVSTYPSVANISIRGKSIGVGSAHFTWYGPGSFSVEADLNGQSKSFKLAFPEAGSHVVALDFDAEPRQVILSIKPNNAGITINGNATNAGTTTVFGPVLTIKAFRNGYEPYEELIGTKPGDRIERKLRLKPVIQPGGIMVDAGGLLLRRSSESQISDTLFTGGLGISYFSKPFLADVSYRAAFGTGFSYSGNPYLILQGGVAGSFGFGAFLGSQIMLYAKATGELGMSGAIALTEKTIDAGAIVPDSYSSELLYFLPSGSIGIRVYGQAKAFFAELGVWPRGESTASSEVIFSPLLRVGMVLNMP